MNKRFLWMLTAILTICGAMMNTSCSDDDNTPGNPLARQVSGMWWALTDSEGSYGVGDHTVDYTRMARALNFNEDGTGYAIALLFESEDSDPDVVIGGETAAPFTYSSRADGTLHLDFSKTVSEEYANYFKNWTITYQNGAVSVIDGQQTLSLEPASDAIAAKITEWDHNAHTGAAAAYFNINDDDFTTDNWRDQEAIYIYDGQGTDVTDSKGRTGYTLVNLPWYEGDKLVNMSPDFCDDLLPVNGWEWVFNRCGSRNIVNNNFFAVYNKYTGILRFFYYQPAGFSAGNDHVWEVTMSDNLANHSAFCYGIPQDASIINKAAISQSQDGVAMCIAPWVSSKSQDGLITPNAGWWAFDVDLSGCRSEGFNTADYIRLQMRSWDAMHTSLGSAMAAAIDGTLAADLKLEETSRTVNSLTGYAADLKTMAGMGVDVYKAISSFKEDKKEDAFNSLISFAKGYCNLAGIDLKEEKTIKGLEGKIGGTINLAMNGHMSTTGIIEGSKPVVGVVSPTFYMKDFDTKNSHLGQGTWNLKTSPMVYVFDWILATNWGWGDANQYGFWGENSWTSYNDYYTKKAETVPPRYGTFWVFDPTSVEVELNPAIFPQDQIEWMEVDALPGARIANKVTGTDAYRAALGLQPRYSNGHLFSEDYINGYVDEWGTPSYSSWKFNFNVTGENLRDDLTDYFYGEEDTHGMTFDVVSPYEHVDSTNQAVYGRGVKDAYILEPQLATPIWYQSKILPPIEISVTVTIKMRNMDKPIVYNRLYLPEFSNAAAPRYNYRNWTNEDAQSTYDAYRKFCDRINKHLISPLQQDHHQVYDYNVKRANTKVLGLIPEER